MKTMIKASALALVLMASAGAQINDRTNLRIAAAWAQLSMEQQSVIELVAKDIWDSERANRGLPYHEISERKRNAIREQAMKRLGFEPTGALGVEA